MKTYYVSSKFDDEAMVQKNKEQAYKVFPKLINIEGSSSVIKTYRKLSEITEEKYFVWVDADNFVYPEARQILEMNEPSILNAENEFGIIYGHGGIKLCPKNVDIRSSCIDVSFYLQLKPSAVLGSFHHLGIGKAKTRAIVVELLKLLLSQREDILNLWQKQVHREMGIALNILETKNFLEIKNLIQSRQEFYNFYEQYSMHSNM